MKWLVDWSGADGVAFGMNPGATNFIIAPGLTRLRIDAVKLPSLDLTSSLFLK